MADTTSTLDETLLRLYSKEDLFDPAERSEPRLWDDMAKAEDERPGGAGLYFEIVGYSSHGYGNPAEGGDWSTPGTRVGVQCSVTSAQIDASFEISNKFLEAARGEGSFRGDAEDDAVTDATTGLYSYLSRLLCGHGTGRMAIVDVTVTGTTITTRKPEMAFALRVNQKIDFVDTDTGGTVQASRTITSIDYAAGTFTVNTSVSVTAGWGVYNLDAYGNPLPNGIRNIVDDGDFASSIFTVSRTAPNLFLNAKVMDGNGGLQDYSEHLVSELLDQITFDQKYVPTQLRCNVGIIGEWRRTTTADRIYNMEGKGGSGFAPSTGSNGDAAKFTYNTHLIPFKEDRDLPARELYALYMPAWRKHILKEAGFAKNGGKILFPKPAAGGETYAHSSLGNMLIDMNVSCRKLSAQGKLSNIRDRSAARDTV